MKMGQSTHSTWDTETVKTGAVLDAADGRIREQTGGRRLSLF